MVRKIRHQNNRGTANRFDGRFDYVLPSPWNVPSSPGNPYAAEVDLFANLSDAATSIPLTILNSNPSPTYYDDDDGPYDILFWDVGADADFGFDQEIYIFREPPAGGNRVENIPLVTGSPIKSITIIIEDFASAPVNQRVSQAEPIVETSASDFGVYRTAASNDVIFGLEGDDTLFSGPGNDLVDGGSGKDFLIGHSGDDQLSGETGDDRLHGLAGIDLLSGGSGNDDLFGGADSDQLSGGSGNDRLNGDAGADTLIGGLGNDLYNITEDTLDTIVELPGQGDDTVQTFLSYTLPAQVERLILVNEAAITGIGNALNNIITDRAVSATFSADALVPSNNIIQAQGGNDLVKTDLGNDSIDGGTGNDLLIGGQGNDTLIGGAGADQFVFYTRSLGYFPDEGGTEDIADFNPTEGDKLVLPRGSFFLSATAGPLPATQFHTGASATETTHRFIYNFATGDLFFDFDGSGGASAQVRIATLSPGLSLSSSNFQIVTDQFIEDLFISASLPSDSSAAELPGAVLSGTADRDRLLGTEGNDTVNLLAGDDISSGAEGNDSLNGGDGKDFLVGGSGDDQVVGEAGADKLYGEAGNDGLNGGSENDTLTGGTGNDVLTGGSGRDRFNFYDPATDGSDQITDFSVSDDQIGLYVGNAQATAFAGTGWVAGQPIAADQFHIGAAAADSNDRLIYNSSTGALLFDADGSGAGAAIQIATLTAGLQLTAANFVAFNETNRNALQPNTPTPNDDTLSGSNGNDTINGNGGNDQINGSNGNDTLNGGDGDDLLQGGAANDKLLGLNGNDRLSGGDGNDHLDGGNGNDQLFGGRGNDRLRGGRGRDIFALERGPGRDRIEDFRDRVDRLGLTAGLRFRQLTLEQKGRNTLIRAGSDDLALLVGIRAEQITASDFVRVTAI